MQIRSIEKDPELTHVILEGSLDAKGVGLIETQFYAHVSHGRDALIDFDAVDFLASLGIRMLVTAARDLKRKGAHLVIARPQPLVQQTLEHVSLDQLVPWFETEAEAKVYLETQ